MRSNSARTASNFGIFRLPFWLVTVGTWLYSTIKPRAAVDQHWDDHFEAVLGQPPRKLILSADPCRQAHDLFWRLIRVRKGHYVRQWRAFGLEQQAFSGHTRQHRPARLVHAICTRLGHERRIVLVSAALHHHRSARIHHSNDLPKALAVGLDRSLIGWARREIPGPVLRSRLD